MTVALSDVGGQLFRDVKRNYSEGRGGHYHEESDLDRNFVAWANSGGGCRRLDGRCEDKQVRRLVYREDVE